MQQKITVLGSGSWGTALALHLINKGFEVVLWSRSPETVQVLKNTRENKKYLPEVKLPVGLKITAELHLAVEQASLLVLAVPSQAIRSIVRLCKPFLHPEVTIVNTAKGFEEASLMRLTQVIASELPQNYLQRITVLSGPSHAEEVSRQLPTTVVVAAVHKNVAEYVQDIFMNPVFRVYTNPDLIGVELGGALKNIIALATGIADGLGFGDNTRAALMTRGIAEIARLGVKMEADPLTFAGLTGIGDLIVTCSSMHSRNRRAGIRLGQGMSLNQVLSTLGMVVEGVTTTKVAFELAKKHEVDMPIVGEVYRVLFEEKKPLDSVSHLMERLKTHEVEEVVRLTNW